MSIASQIVTWTLVVIGWIIVDDRNNAREERKEIRSLINDIKIKIENVKDLAISYHTSPSHSGDMSFKIKLCLKNIGEISSILKMYSINLDMAMVAKIRQSITIVNFDTTKFVQFKHTDRIIFDIIDSCDSLISELDHAFLSKYSKSISKLLSIKAKALFYRSKILYKKIKNRQSH